MEKPKSKINLKLRQIIFFLNPKIYSLEAIYSTAYVFVDRVYIYLDGNPEREIIVFLKSKNKSTRKQLEALRGEFYNELLNYLLRTQIAKHSQKLREFIVGTALVSALPASILVQSPQPKTVKTAGWQADPLGIAASWKEKYGKKTKIRIKK